MRSDSTPAPASSPVAPAADVTSEVFAGLEEIAHRALGIKDALTRSDTLTGTLGLDSLGLLSLAVEVEDAFRITLGEEEQDVRTVGDLCDLIARRLAEARS